MKVTEKAYAKLNLILNVLGKREDGYHEIDTIFQAINLYDIVDVNCRSTKGFTEVNVKCLSDGLEIDDISKKDNLAYKAAILMHDTFHSRENEIIDIVIDKRIPIAGGLGGGSSDGAAVIYALASLWGIPIDDDVYRLAASLGADVPFLLAVQSGITCARARGIGEKLEFAKGIDEDIELLLQNINISNKTARVYAEFDICSKPSENDYVERFLKAEKEEEKLSFLHNDLQKALEKITERKIDDYILCGAGPTYFRIARPDEDKGFIVHTL